MKAFIERFYCIAEEDPDPPFGRYEKYPVKDCALLMTSADDFSGHLNRRFPITGLHWSIISGSMIRAWCLRAGAEIPMAGHGSIKRTICRQHMNLERVFINREDGMHHYDLTGI